jgi:hypothetical protein
MNCARCSQIRSTATDVQSDPAGRRGGISFLPPAVS